MARVGNKQEWQFAIIPQNLASYSGLAVCEIISSPGWPPPELGNEAAAFDAPGLQPRTDEAAEVLAKVEQAVSLTPDEIEDVRFAGNIPDKSATTVDLLDIIEKRMTNADRRATGYPER